jgi:hypothetical protein
MTAPASAKALAAASTAARISGSRGMPTPASIITPIFKPLISMSRSSHGRSW